MVSTLTSIPSPYVELDRQDWARLRRQHPLSLTDDDVSRLTGLGERLDQAEIEEVYLPLSRLLSYYVEGTGHLHRITSNFLGERPDRTPFIIGVAGSVAVGKSTTARILRELMARWPSTPRVELVTTDGFLYPNSELHRRGLLQRKGFPESYDQRALMRFVAEVKSGKDVVRAPVYSHLTYDIVPDQQVVVSHPDVLIVEGLNVLQSARVRADGRSGLAVSDFFDFSVYVDARLDDIRRWYVERFLKLRATAFAKPESYFHQYAAMSDEQARDKAESIWHSINEPNLVANVVTTRGRATLILNKGGDHSVHRVRLRKL